jgi:hypothetical protein
MGDFAKGIKSFKQNITRRDERPADAAMPAERAPRTSPGRARQGHIPRRCRARRRRRRRLTGRAPPPETGWCGAARRSGCHRTPSRRSARAAALDALGWGPPPTAYILAPPRRRGVAIYRSVSQGLHPARCVRRDLDGVPRDAGLRPPPRRPALQASTSTSGCGRSAARPFRAGHRAVARAETPSHARLRVAEGSGLDTPRGRYPRALVLVQTNQDIAAPQARVDRRGAALWSRGIAARPRTLCMGPRQTAQAMLRWRRLDIMRLHTELATRSLSP